MIFEMSEIFNGIYKSVIFLRGGIPEAIFTSAYLVKTFLEFIDLFIKCPKNTSP